MANHSTQKNIYDKNNAFYYDKVIEQPIYQYYVTKKLNFIEKWVKNNYFILEVGCGTGVYTTALARQCETIIGLDLSLEMTKRGNLKAKNLGLKNIHFVVGDAANSPIRDGIFDFVFSVNLFHHIANEKIILKGLKEKIRCSKQGSHILIFELNPTSLGWSYDPIPKALRSLAYFLLSTFNRKTLENAEEGTKMVNIPELLHKNNKIEIISTQIGGFIPPYCPKYMLKLFISLEKLMENTPILKRYGAHIFAVGKVH